MVLMSCTMIRELPQRSERVVLIGEKKVGYGVAELEPSANRAFWRRRRGPDVKGAIHS